MLAWLTTHRLRPEDVGLLLSEENADLDGPGILGRLTRTPLSANFLRLRFDRVLRKLRQASSGLTIEELARLDDRYIQLRKRATSGADPVLLNSELDRLETDLDRRR